MSFDSVYKGPTQSRKSKAVKGQVFKDSRYELNQKLHGVSNRLNIFRREVDSRSVSSASPSASEYQIQSFKQFRN